MVEWIDPCRCLIKVSVIYIATLIPNELLSRKLISMAKLVTHYFICLVYISMNYTQAYLDIFDNGGGNLELTLVLLELLKCCRLKLLFSCSS